MDVNEMIKRLVDDTPKVDITKEQLKKIETYVVAYMSAALVQQVNHNLGTQTIKTIDGLWDNLFTVINEDLENKPN